MINIIIVHELNVKNWPTRGQYISLKCDIYMIIIYKYYALIVFTFGTLYFVRT